MDQQHNFSINDLPKIRVVVRKRPLNSKEKGKNDKDILDIKSDSSLVVKEIK
jgi:kinesin family member 2/24